MKLSIYTFARDALYLDFHLVDMLKHHLPLADEIIVDEGYSTDGTYEAIKDIDPKIRIFRNEWDRSDPKTWSIKYRNRARMNCTGDWCIMLDADEFIPEWEFDRLRALLESAHQPVVRMKYLNFYGNYKVFNARPEKFGWPVWKCAIHRNLPEIAAWGDGANVRFGDKGDVHDKEYYAHSGIIVHHFGTVRHAARLRQKWRNQEMRNRHGSDKKPRWDRTPGLLFDAFPHRWDDSHFMEDLQLYEGPYVQAVRDNPDEFTRDNMMLCDFIQKRDRAAKTSSDCATDRR